MPEGNRKGATMIQTASAVTASSLRRHSCGRLVRRLRWPESKAARGATDISCAQNLYTACEDLLRSDQGCSGAAGGRSYAYVIGASCVHAGDVDDGERFAPPSGIPRATVGAVGRGPHVGVLVLGRPFPSRGRSGQRSSHHAVAGFTRRLVDVIVRRDVMHVGGSPCAPRAARPRCGATFHPLELTPFDAGVVTP